MTMDESTDWDKIQSNKCQMKDEFGGTCKRLTTRKDTVFCSDHIDKMCDKCGDHHATHKNGKFYICYRCVVGLK